jgi:N6-adenosine-specific RNA methylase IME4
MSDLAIVVAGVKAGEVSLAREAPRMLAFVSGLTDPEDLRECKAQAAAVAEYLAQRRDASVEEYNAAVKVKARVEHRLGEVLAETVSTNRYNTALHLPREITPMQSSRAQQLAGVPWEKIEARIDEATAKNRRASLARDVNPLVVAAKVSGGGPDDGKAVVRREFRALIDSGGRYGTIYADPPWKYGNQGTRAATDRHYPTMAVAEIAALEVGKLAAEQSHLHLWVTKPFLPDGLRVLSAWGFEYKSWLLWVKPQLGLGNYWRSSSEMLLLGVRGGLLFPPTNFLDWLEQKRGWHSAKPHKVRKLIEKVSPGPRLELFARETAPGWTVWGDQVASDGLFDGDVVQE